ncbi:hypothetical protein TcG_11158, partial [Trypanosoma cruzi]
PVAAQHRRTSTQLLLKHPLTVEKWIHPGCPDRPQEAFLGGRDRSSETDGRQDTPPTPGVTLPLLLVPVRCFFCLPLLPPWQHSMDFAVCSALRCEATALPPAWPAPSIGCPIEKHPFQWVPFSICMCCVRSV